MIQHKKTQRFLEPEAPNEQIYTTWYNPNKEVQWVDIMATPGRWTRYKVKSEGRVQIPSEYDYAIQVVRDGVVKSGMAPTWIRESYGPMGGEQTFVPEEERPVLDSNLDPLKSLAKVAEKQAIDALLQKRHAEEALLAAQSVLAERAASAAAVVAAAEAKAKKEAELSEVKRGPGRPPKNKEE
jgi:hypothetical protein